MNEPVYNITLTDYVREKLQKTQEAYGHAVFQEALATLDSAVAAQLTSLIQWLAVFCWKKNIFMISVISNS